MSTLVAVITWVISTVSIAVLGDGSWISVGILIFIFLTIFPFIHGYLFEYFASSSDRLE